MGVGGEKCVGPGGGGEADPRPVWTPRGMKQSMGCLGAGLEAQGRACARLPRFSPGARETCAPFNDPCGHLPATLGRAGMGMCETTVWVL